MEKKGIDTINAETAAIRKAHEELLQELRNLDKRYGNLMNELGPAVEAPAKGNNPYVVPVAELSGEHWRLVCEQGARVLRTQNYGVDTTMSMFVAEIAMELAPRPWLIDGTVLEDYEEYQDRYREDRERLLKQAAHIIAIQDMSTRDFISVYKILKYCGIDIPPFMVETVVLKLKGKPALYKRVKRIMKEQDWTMEGVDKRYQRLESELMMSYGWEQVLKLGKTNNLNELNERILAIMNKYVRNGLERRPVIRMGADALKPGLTGLMDHLAQWIDAEMLVNTDFPAPLGVTV